MRVMINAAAAVVVIIIAAAIVRGVPQRVAVALPNAGRWLGRLL